MHSVTMTGENLMKPNLKQLTLVALFSVIFVLPRVAFTTFAATLMTVVPLSGFAAGDDDHIFCSYTEEPRTVDSSERRIFYTAVFLGDDSFTTGYTNDFRDYLKEEYDFRGVEDNCFFEDKADSASRDLDRAVRSDESSDVYSSVIKTGWTPDDFSINAIVKELQLDFGKCADEVKVSVKNNKLMLFGKHLYWQIYQDFTIPLDRLDKVKYDNENLSFECSDEEGDCIEQEKTWVIDISPVRSATINFRGNDCNFKTRKSIEYQIGDLMKQINLRDS